MALYIPKVVVLQNVMLARCYLVLSFLTAFSMLGWFYLSGGYLMSLSLRHRLRMNMWANVPDDGALNDTLLPRQGDVCGSPTDYDYWWNELAQFNGSKCVEVSSRCNPQKGACLRTTDINAKEGPHQVFLATYATASRQRADGEIEEPFRYYVPQVNAFSVGFEYYFTVPHMPMFWSKKHVSRPPVSEEQRLSNQEVLTVFLDSNRDIARIARPGEALEMSVPAILQMAGYADHLLTPNPWGGKNVFPGATYPEGPIGLITGLPVEIVVHCHKTPKRDLGEDYGYWTGPTCYVIAAAQEMWSEKHESDRLGATGVLHSYRSGIRITGEMDGTWEYFDLDHCILSFTALLVMMRLPKELMTWISCRALGHLSKIYRTVVFQRFCIEEQIAGAAARILSHSASFREIEHTDGHGGLSHQGLHDALSYVARLRKEDAPSLAKSMTKSILTGNSSQEQENTVMLFSDFAFNAICNPMYREHGRRARFFRKVFGQKIMTVVEAFFWFLSGETVVVHQDDSEKKERVASRMSVDRFISSAGSSEQVRYETLLLFFNVSRVVGRLERWFTPTFISKYFEQKHQELRCFEQKHQELREAERSRIPWSQETPTGEEMRDQGSVGPSTDDFGVSSRNLIKRLLDDLRHVRESKDRSAAATSCLDGLPDGDVLAGRPSLHFARTGMPRLAQGETLATLSPTAANHARPPGQDPQSKERLAAATNCPDRLPDGDLLAGPPSVHRALTGMPRLAQGETLPALSSAAANHARPPGQDPGDTLPALSSAAANHARPPGPEEGADVRVEVDVLDRTHDGDPAAVLGRTAADHARPLGHEEAQGADDSAEARLMDPELLGFWLEGCRLRWPGEGGPAVLAAAEGRRQRATSFAFRGSHSCWKQNQEGSPTGRPVLPPGQPTDGGAAGADAAADGTRQPTGQG